MDTKKAPPSGVALLFCLYFKVVTPNRLGVSDPERTRQHFDSLKGIKINVLMRSSPHQATVHRTVAFRFSSPSEDKKEKPSYWMAFFFGDPERTRTVDLQRDRLAC